MAETAEFLTLSNLIFFRELLVARTRVRRTRAEGWERGGKVKTICGGVGSMG